MSNDNIRILSHPISYRELKSIDKDVLITGIYKIENTVNHKVYIGKSVNIIRRLKQHTTQITNEHLYNSISKYGIDKFSFEVIKETYDLDYWEIFLIQIYHATDDRYGYNVAPGGEGGQGNWIFLSEDKKRVIKDKLSKANKNKIISEEQRKLISSKLKGRPSKRKGTKSSKETRLKLSLSQKKRFENIEERRKTGMSVHNSIKYQNSRKDPKYLAKLSLANKGHHLTDETKRKISEKHRGKKMSKEFCDNLSRIMKGRKFTEEHKRKISLSNKGKQKEYLINTHWYNNGIENYRGTECPPGFVLGRINFNNVGNKGMKWWNNGVVQVQSFECPEGFVRGKLPMKEETKEKIRQFNLNKHNKNNV